MLAIHSLHVICSKAEQKLMFDNKVLLASCFSFCSQVYGLEIIPFEKKLPFAHKAITYIFPETYHPKYYPFFISFLYI